ncbi:MAG: four-carbon acid sugar kinase family protein, partial [Mycobacterium sp.]
AMGFTTTVLRHGEPSIMLIVIDDDPTGTQSVSDLPVLTRWTRDDLEWAAADSPAVYLQTNSRSLSEQDAAAITHDAAAAALALFGDTTTLISRSDSTLRGHFLAETDALIAASNAAGTSVDAIVLAPAFPQAGRVTVDGVHYLENNGHRTPVAQSEFAADLTFGYQNSDLRDWVVEKSAGRYTAANIAVLERNSTSVAAVEELLTQNPAVQVIIVDAESDAHLFEAASALLAAEQNGRKFVYRVGPPFVRAMLGRPSPAPVDASDFGDDADDAGLGGLIVVGSHVDVTARQLSTLCERHPDLPVIELDVDSLSAGSSNAVDVTATALQQALESGDAILQTTRALRRADSPEESLELARRVSMAVSGTVKQALNGVRPRFVIAKGGITSSDVATHGLDVTRATIVGPVLPGIVALWRIESGPLAGTRYVVFPGNVGDSNALDEVYQRLSASTTGAAK